MGQKEFYNGTSDIYILLNRVPCQPDVGFTVICCGFWMPGPFSKTEGS